jgi:hypothetical protein
MEVLLFRLPFTRCSLLLIDGLVQELLELTKGGTSVLPLDYTYLFVAGLFNEFYPGYLREAVEHFNTLGVSPPPMLPLDSSPLPFKGPPQLPKTPVVALGTLKPLTE